jgi:phage tail sheath gpL-like
MTAQERNVLYFDGIGGFTVTREGTVRIDRMLTTYQTNANGDPDSSYLDVQVLAQLQYLIRFFRFKITQTYPRASLKKDSEKRLPGQFSVRPKDIKATMIAGAKELANQNVIEDVEVFAQLIIVQISESDPNCVEMVISPDLVNQWRLGKTLVQFYNQYPSTETLNF